MANATPSRVGQQLGTGDTRALFLKVFSGEVLTTFNTKVVMKDKVRVRSISSGKSAQFPAIGKHQGLLPHAGHRDRRRRDPAGREGHHHR
jgi:hypothetical protein